MVTGYPVRQDIFRVTRADGRSLLGLGEGLVLLVVGGSRGARSINQEVHDSLDELLARCEMIHVSGEGDHAWLQERRNALPVEAQSRYHLYRFLDKEMPAALVSADLIVCRAGASVLGELPAAGLPGVLVPYPYAGRHQEANADQLVRKGVARRLDDAELKTRFLDVVLQTLGDSEGLRRMAVSAKAEARPEATRALAGELIRLANGHGGHA
jgi:UDP-N-acetylglucosamine--N-acetylmuramyl-(pentapeptide) pyrophosphoryl-undecaprenol N-acetylglucosamine transferase